MVSKETREGWILLTVETKENRGSGSTYERGLSLVGSLVYRSRTRYFCPALAAQVYQIFFLHRALFHFILTHLLARGQAVVPGRLSLNVCLCVSDRIQFQFSLRMFHGV
jgi:hypothetical protein